MYDHVIIDDMIAVEDYLRTEYQFYYLMNTLPIPSVALMPQIAMGGGIGL